MASKNFKAAIIIEGDSKGGVRAIQATNKELDNLDKNAKKSTKSFKDVESSLISLKGALAGLGVAAIGTQLIAVARQTENFKAQLKTMTGSMDAANTAFNRLNEFAKTTPYTLDQSIQGFVKLKALGLDPSERAMKSYGNTASAMGKSMEQMVEAVADASTFEFERLKEFGIKAKQQGDNVTLTFRGVETTIKKSSENIQQYLLNIGETHFDTAMSDRMNTIDGQLSNLEQSFNDLWREMGEALHIDDIIKDSLSNVASLINSMTDIIKTMRLELTVTAEWFAAYQADKISFWEWFTTGKEGAIEGLQRLNDELGIESDALNQLKKAIDSVDTSQGKLNKENKKGTKETENLDKAFIDLNTELEEQIYLLTLTAKEQFIYTNLKKIDASATETQLKAIRESAGALFDMREALKKAKDTNKETTQTIESDWDRLNDNIKSQFIDTFADMLTGAEVDFKDFANSILKMWINTTANMVFNPQMGSNLVAGPGQAPSSGGIGGIGSFLGNNFATSAIQSVGTYIGLSGAPGIGGAIASAAPYALPAVLLASAFGLFDDDPLPTEYRIANQTGGKTLKDYLAGAGHRAGASSVFGSLRFGVSHTGDDGQIDEATAAQLTQQMQARLEALAVIDETIVRTLNLSDDVVDEISRAIESRSDSEVSGSLEDFLADRFGKISDIVAGEFNEVYDVFTTLDESIGEAVAAALAYVTASDDIKTLYRELYESGERSSTAIMGLTNNLFAVNTMFESIGSTMLDLSADGALLAQSLVEAAGGIQNLSSDLNYYFNNFLGEDDRNYATLQNAIKIKDQINAKYGLNIQTKADYEAFVNSLGSEGLAALNGEQYTDLQSMMYALNEGWAAYAELTKPVEESGEAAKDTTSAISSLTEAFESGGDAPEDFSNEINQLVADLQNVTSSIKSLRESILDSGLSIASQMPNFNMVGYQTQLINTLKGQLTGTSSDIEVYSQIRQAIMDRYQAEAELITDTHNTELANRQELYDLKLDEWEAEKRHIDELNNAYERIGDYLTHLGLSNLSPYSSSQQLSLAKNQFGVNLLKAQAGDLDALGALTGNADDYLNAKLATAKNGLEYRQIFNQVRNALGGLADKRLSYSAFELEAINLEQEELNLSNKLQVIQEAALNSLQHLDGSVASLETTLLAGFNAQTTQLWDKLDEDTKALIKSLFEVSSENGWSAITNNLTSNPLIGATQSTYSPGSDYTAVSPNTGIERSGTIVDTPSGVSNQGVETGFGPIIPIINGLPAYAEGTDFVPFTGPALLHHGEAVLTAQDNAQLHEEIRALRDENRALSTSLIKLTNKMKKVFDKWDNDGLPAERAA